MEIANKKNDGAGEFNEKVINVNRVAKVVKGGRRFSFSALVVVGDGKGQLGVGLGKAGEVPEAIRKGTEQAKKNIRRVSLNGTTIPHQVIGHYGAGKVLLRPASEGTGVIAGGVVRAVLEAAGVHDILSKSIGSKNPHNVVRATLKGLDALRSKEEYFGRLNRASVQGLAYIRQVLEFVMRKLRIKQIRSTIGRCEKQRLTIKGLGLGKINREVVLEDTSAVRGMVTKVQHLVQVTVEGTK